MENLTVHSDKRRKMRYFVTANKKIVYQTKYGSQAIQWAIDHSDKENISVHDTIELGRFGKIEIEKEKPLRKS